MTRFIKFEIVRSASTGLYYSHLVSSNGKIIFDGAEGYDRKAGARRAIKSLINHILAGKYTIEGEKPQ